MSWQGYIDNLMLTGTMTSVGIFALDGTPWAVSNGFPVKKQKKNSMILTVKCPLFSKFLISS